MEEVVVVQLETGIGYKLNALPEVQPYLEAGYFIKDHFIAPAKKTDDRRYCHLILTLALEMGG